MDSSSDELQRVFVTLFELVKKKEALILRDGEIKERVCILLWKYIVTLEHGTHLQMHFSTWVIFLSSSPTKFLESSYSFELSKNTITVSCNGGLVSFSCQYFQVMPCPCSREVWSYFHYFLSIYLLSCWSSLSQSRTSLYCLVYSKTSLIMFRVDDGGFIMVLLRRVYSFRLQLLIWELDLETKTSTLGMHALRAGYLTFNMSLHH